MNESIARRLTAAVAGTALAPRLAAALEPLLARRGADPALAQLAGPMVGGLARALSAQPEVAGFLSHRPHLLARIAGAGAGTLAARARELDADPLVADAGDLETALDALRLLRREETCLAACIHQAGLAPFEQVSLFLSILAEAIVRSALALARRAPGVTPSSPFAVLGMGKVAGREFTYHSDLDLIFLYGGDPDAVLTASRIGQRLISFLTTLTGAGIAYAVDTHLRPSGRQGALVVSFAGFERYQLEQAQTWEHVAVLRARAIAGDVVPARESLARVHANVLGRREPPWEHLVDVRSRVERERADETGRIALKTGPGGLMDVDFLAAGSLIERGAARMPELPSVPALLRAGARGPRVEALLADFALLRRVEAAARWLAGRGVEGISLAGETLDCVAELTDPGSDGKQLGARVAAARGRIRSAWSRVVEAGTIAALER
jgi:glutamate-ammonia-ligase adenylyltransferase